MRQSGVEEAFYSVRSIQQIGVRKRALNHFLSEAEVLGKSSKNKRLRKFGSFEHFHAHLNTEINLYNSATY